MSADVRNVIIAILAGIAMLLLIAVPVFSETWNSGKETGLVSVKSTFVNGTYTWVLSNKSSLSEDPYSGFDILVWTLVPFRVREPLNWVAPEGWKWSGNRWEINAKPCEKYRTPYALGPGQTVTFIYTPDPNGKFVNDKGPQPADLDFIAHVGAVVPESGSLDGSIPWTPVDTGYGKTWFDRPTGNTMDYVPEPSGPITILTGVIGFLACLRRRRYPHDNLPMTHAD